MNIRILLPLLLWVSAVPRAQTAPKWRFVESWRKGEAVEGAYAFDGMLNSPPSALAAAPGGRIVVLDASQSRLHILDSTGAVVRSFGRDGAGPGEFRFGSGIAVSHDGRILVNDPFNGRYVLYAANGDFVRVIPIVRKYLFAFDMMWHSSQRSC